MVDTEATSERDTTLGIADFAASRHLVELNLTAAVGIPTEADPTAGTRPRPGRSEGDIAIENIARFVNDSNRLGRAAIRSSWRRWSDGQIPYVLSSRYGRYSRRVIARAMDRYHRESCVRFVPRDRDRHRDYIYIVPDDGCYSLVGRTGGRQPVRFFDSLS